MARGWESKSIESQQNEPLEARYRKKSADEISRERQRHSLEMSRRRIVSELQITQSPGRRASLEAALQHLDAELAKLL